MTQTYLTEVFLVLPGGALEPIHISSVIDAPNDVSALRVARAQIEPILADSILSKKLIWITKTIEQ